MPGPFASVLAFGRDERGLIAVVAILVTAGEAPVRAHVAGTRLDGEGFSAQQGAECQDVDVVAPVGNNRCF